MTKNFNLMQLFSIVDGRLSNSGMDAVYDVLNHITDDNLMTHHLPVAMDYLKDKNPTWFTEIKKSIGAIIVLCPIKERNHEQFEWLMGYITKNNPEYQIPQLKDEFDTSDFGSFMVDNSLLLKKINA